MEQREDENLEEYISRFLLCLRKSSDHTLNQETQKLLFLRGVSDSYTDALDLIGGGDITQLPWDDIKKICQNYSRAAVKKGRGMGKPFASGV